MPNGEQTFSLEQLKTDPKMWMRLAMPSKYGDSLESVFKEKENPFEKNTQAAVETMQRLAAEGKLYLRDFGRSRHFHKVENDKDGLKLGDQQEIKFSNRTTGPAMGVLMWLSKHYFKWIGLDAVSKWLGFNGISNWFDNRLKRRAEIIELNDRYKEEYRSLSKEQKKELKTLRKHEKNLKKLEKLQKEADKTQAELDKLRGVDTKNKGEMDSPLNQPPKVEQKDNTLQPTLLGDQPVQEQKLVQPTLGNNSTQLKTEQQEVPGEKKENTGEKTKPEPTVLNGVEYTKENMHELPEIVREALQLIQQLIEQQKAVEQQLQQLQQLQQQQPTNENVQQPEKNENSVQPIDNEIRQQEPVATEEIQAVEVPQNTEEVTGPKAEEMEEQRNQPIGLEGTVEQEVTLNIQDDLEMNLTQNEEQVQTNDHHEPEQAANNNPDQRAVGEEVPMQQINAPLRDGANLEPEQVNIQERHEDQAQMNLQERLAEEKIAMDAVNNWKDRLLESLFSHEEDKTMREYYQMINNNNEATGAEFLIGTVCGILTNNAQTLEQKQQVMDALLSGKPLGKENEQLIENGVAAYNDAIARNTGGHSERLANMVADSMRELSYQASRETSLSPRMVMLGKILKNTAKMADDYKLELPMEEDELKLASGAGTLAEVTLKYHEARQRLGNDLENIGKKRNKEAVRDLLMGSTVDKMIQYDQGRGQAITDTQIIMGQGMWELENLRVYTGDAARRKGIRPEDVKVLLEKPNSTKALGIGSGLGAEIARASSEDYAAAQDATRKEMELEKQANPPEINPVNIPG